MAAGRILLAGESWVTVTFEIKGRNVLRDSAYDEAADQFISMLEALDADVTYQPCHVAEEAFPRTVEALDQYDVVILSDIGADTLQLTDRVRGGEVDVDRCSVLADWVWDGGALGMVGGYMSFSGKGGTARYSKTALSEILPVTLAEGDDRVETPAGVNPKTETIPDIDVPAEWPAVLGYNKLWAKEGAAVWATVNDDPFLVVDDVEDGTAFAYATDFAPHWAPTALLKWKHLPAIWERLLTRVVTGH